MTKSSVSHMPHGILLSLQMICDDLDEILYDDNNTIQLAGDSPCLSGIRLWYSGCPMMEHILYILPESGAEEFPSNQYPYISVKETEGTAPHICIPGYSTVELMNTILEIFQRFREFESSMNAVITGNGTLNDLCLIGSRFFQNPLYIHDNMFTVIALPVQVQGMLKFEKSEETGEMHIPIWLINDFKFDEAYQATLSLRQSAIWGTDQYPHNMRSLFVNLWEGDYYYGRLLINEIESSLKPGQRYLAEVFAEYCKMIIRRDINRSQNNIASHEETLHAMVNGEPIDHSDLTAMMETLSWLPGHRFQCLKVISQNPRTSVRSDDALRSSLALKFKNSVMFFHEHSLCVLINLSLLQISPGDTALGLAPLIRDNCVYAGLSDPVTLGPDVYSGFRQAEIALDYIRRKKTTNWLVVFSDYALDYLLETFDSSIPRKMLIPQALNVLRNHDREKGTQFYTTLKTYILNERSIPKTAAALYIHRTTLLYRLEKIGELIAVNLDDPDVRLHLQIAFHFIEK